MADKVQQAKRLGSIVQTFARYGLAGRVQADAPDWLQGWFTEPEGRLLAEYNEPERLRMALTELGTTFIKLGQMMSTRVDIIGPEYAEELAKLQSDVPADPPEAVRELVEFELGRELPELFASFSEKPLGSASIGQVHAATLHDGTEVVVKVQHAGIEKKVISDLDLLKDLAALAERYSADLRLYRPTAISAEFRRSLLRELDFTNELRNLEQFAHNFENEPDVLVPKAHWDYSTRYILTMEKLAGYEANRPRMLQEGVDTAAFANRFTRVCLDMIFRDGFYHADPHPGNIFVVPELDVGVIDVGKVGWVDEQIKESFGDIMRDFLTKDARQLTDDLIRLCEVPPDLNRDAYQSDVSAFVAEYGDIGSGTSMGDVFNSMFGIVRKHRLRMPARVTMFLQVLVIIDGTGQVIDPNFSLIEILGNYQRNLLLRQISPEMLSREFMRQYRDWDRVVKRLPREINGLLDKLEQGELTARIAHQNLDRPVNRLIYGMLAAAFVMAAAVLWSLQGFSSDNGLSLLGVAFMTIAGYLIWRLLRAIAHSGGL